MEINVFIYKREMLFKIVGLFYRGINGMTLEDTKITLIEEPDNIYDKNAIKAFANDHHIGYVSKKYIPKVKEYLNRSHKIKIDKTYTNYIYAKIKYK